MDTSMFFASLIIAVGMAFLVIILAIRMRDGIRKSAIGSYSSAREGSQRADPEVEPLAREYGMRDCYVDCMRAFRWESKKRGECSAACGLQEA